MKYNLKKLVALLLSALLLLSVCGLSEEAIVIEDGAAVEGASGDGIPAVGDVDLEEPLDISDVLVLDAGVQTPAGDEAIAPETHVEDAITANALVTKVKLGVNEKYTIDTSSLSGNLTFKSSKPDIVSVSKKGVIKGKKAGTARITITTAAGKKYKIAVVVAKAPSTVTLNKTSATLETGDTLQLKATLPKKTASNKITWTSSDKNVATVSDTGKVTAKAVGEATITVRTFNGKKASCNVAVKKRKPFISVDKTNVSLGVDESTTITVTYTGSGTLYWDTNSRGIAYCNWLDDWYEDSFRLHITGGKAGHTVITVGERDTGLSASINVAVTGPSSEVGDILKRFDMNIDALQYNLEEPLTYDRHDKEENCDIYRNDYMTVYVSTSTKLVTKISLAGDTSGKYSLCGIHPGIDFSKAKEKATATGWNYDKSNGDIYYYFGRYKKQDVVLAIEKQPGTSTVKSVMVYAR